MQRFISALRRSLNGETKEKCTSSQISNEIDVKRDALFSMENEVHVDVDPEDDFYEVLNNVFPSSSPLHSYISCENSNENLSSPLEMDDLTESFSPQQATSSKKTQHCSVKSVAVQCDPPTKDTKGVQWEPPIMVSQSIQCNLMPQESKEIQCDSITQMTQSMQYESVLMVATGVQYESPSPIVEKQASENVPSELSEGVNCELVFPSEKPCGNDNQQDLSITWPSLQKELDVVDSQTSVYISSSSTTSSSERGPVDDVSAPKSDLIVCSQQAAQSDRCSKPVSSTSGGMLTRKRESMNKALNMRSYSQRCVNSVKSFNTRNKKITHRKCSDKRPPLEVSNDRHISLKEDANSDESNSEQENEAATAEKVPLLEEAASCKESSHNESAEELLQQMGNKENWSGKEDTSNIEHGTPKKSINKEIVAQKTIRFSSPQNEAACDIAVSSQSQRADGLEWFSSLACERYSSPESIAEDMFEELKEHSSNCNKNLAQRMQSTDTKILEKNVSFHGIKSSTPKRENSNARTSDNSSKSPSRKRKKLTFDAKNSDRTSALSKPSAQLVPYSNSDSETSGSDVIESDNEMSKKIVSKMQQHKETIQTVSGNQTKVTLLTGQPRQESSKKNNGEKASSTHRRSRSNSSSCSEKNRYVHHVIYTSESENDDDDSTKSLKSRNKTSRDQKNKINVSDQQGHESSSKSGNVSVRKTVCNDHFVAKRDSVKHKPARLNIWSSDDEDGDSCDVSYPSTVTYHSSGRKRRTVRRGGLYTKEEREAILWYIIDHKYYKLIKGKVLWERMEKEQVCLDRTWQSMKEHFIKKILPQIETFNLKPEIARKLIGLRR